MKIPSVIEELIKKGITVELKHSDEYGLYFDMNTYAKSNLHLVLKPDDEDSFIAYLRYNESKEVSADIHSITYLVKECMAGRDYVDHSWSKLMIELGMAQTETTTKVIY